MDRVRPAALMACSNSWLSVIRSLVLILLQSLAMSADEPGVVEDLFEILVYGLDTGEQFHQALA